MNDFPFSSEQLARLTALSHSVNLTSMSRLLNDSGPIKPMPDPVVLDDAGRIWIAAANGSDDRVGWYLHAGLRVAWTPVPERNGLILIQLGGPAAAPGFEEEGVVTFYNRDGFKRYIADLRAIDAQLGAML